MTRLGDVSEIVSGSTPKTGVPEYWDGDIPWVTPADLSKLEGHFIADTPRKLTKSGLRNSGARMLPIGSVLFSSRAPIGHVAINSVPMSTNQGFKSFVPEPDRVDSKYLFWWLRANKTYLQNLGVGATFKEVSKSIVSEVRFPLPPIAEQRRITIILDRTDGLRAKGRRAIALLDELAESSFSELTRNGKGRRASTIGEVADIQTGPFGSLLHREDYVSSGIPLVNPMHILDGQIRTDPDHAISEAKYAELQAYALQPGDVVLGRRGEMGRAAEVLAEHGRMICGTGSLIIRPRPHIVTGGVLARLLATTAIRESLERRAQGVTMLNLNQSIVSGTLIDLPSFSTQVEYARVRNALERSKNLQLAYLTRLDELLQSLQIRAFTGRL